MTQARPLCDTLQRYLSAGGQQRAAALGELLAALKQTMREENFQEAADVLRRAVLPTLDYTAAQSLYRVFRQLRDRIAAGTPTVKLAVLSSSTSRQLSQLIELQLFAIGAVAEIYEAGYGVFRQEILDGGSPLYHFGPRIVFLATGWRDLAHRPDLSDDRPQVERLLRRELAEFSTLWQTLHDRLGCQIIQNNFEQPPWRTLDNHETRHPAGFGRFLTRLNLAMADEAPDFVTIHDVDHLAAAAGRWAWSDERFFHHAKLPCAPELLVDYAHSVASLVGAHLGLGKKCLVLDLDNTLWGGVIGDDGLGGIRLGQGDAESEAYLAFQRYVQGLQRRGVILAVCSKNEDRVAREVFEKHPEMVLRLDDVSCFVANWTDKATNLRTIAQRLNIGLGSLVLVDDNPAERALVRRLTPEVAVPELPEDPAGYVRAIEQHRYFQLVSLGAEDYRRTDYYRANAERDRSQSSAGCVDDFLRSMQMTARIGPIEPATLLRSAQLINKSNQFNLTTRRYSAAELAAIVDDHRWITLTVALADRFGDNGLISVLLGRVDGDVLEIDTWLMSCRVLKRGVERFLLNHLHELALGRGLVSLRGRYIPTPRNAIVAAHYAELGFDRTAAEENGETQWELPVRADRQPLPCFIANVARGGSHWLGKDALVGRRSATVLNPSRNVDAL